MFGHKPTIAIEVDTAESEREKERAIEAEVNTVRPITVGTGRGEPA